MIFLLTVIFFDSQGEPYLRDGWYPIELPTSDRCEAGKARIEQYLEEIEAKNSFDNVSDYQVKCLIK